MSAEDKYLQFPLCALALPDEGLLESIISYGLVEAGSKAMSKMSVDERKAKCEQFGLRASRYGEWDLAAQVGGEVCGIIIHGSVDATLKRHHALVKQIEEWVNCHGFEPLVRIRTDICFKARDGEGLSVREFRVLCAIYSSIGANPFRAVTEPVIRVRAIGCKGVAVMNAENGSLPPLLTRKEARGIITRLHELGFFARVTPFRHGRKTFYSHRLTDAELRDRIVASKTYSVKFANEHREKNQDLAERIRKEKGHYNSEPEAEGDAAATEGPREGHYDRKPFNRKPNDRKPSDSTHHSPCGDWRDGAFSSLPESDKAILSAYNRFARTHKNLGFLEVDKLTDEVQKALEVFEVWDPDDFLELLEEEAQDPKGARTFVRCCWNNY